MMKSRLTLPVKNRFHGCCQINLSPLMKKPVISIRIALIFGCLTEAVVVTAAHGAGGKPPTRLPTAPGTPALIAAGPNAEDLAKAAQKKEASANDAAANPTEAAP